jgi:HAD superfamily hydrolase (TIGR01509 family)
MLRPRALLFDMDGLMVDSEPLWWRCEGKLAAEHGGVWTLEMARSCMGTGLPNAVAAMRDRLGLPTLEVERGVARLVELFIASLADLELKPGCAELVEAACAAGLRLAVASSSTERLIAAVLARFELGPRFDAVVSGEAVARLKPAPDIFLEAARRLEVAPGDCVVLEDSRAGVTAGAAAGMPVIAVPEWDRESFAALSPHVVVDLHEARRLLAL